MKHILTTFAAVAAAVLAAGCSSEEETPLEDILSISPESKSVISAGADVSVSVESNYPVSATCSQSWLSAEMGEGECIVSVDENPSYEIRRAEVTFTTSKGASAVFSLTQFAADKPSEDVISTSVTEIASPWDGGSYEVTVSANYDVTVSVSAGWVSASLSGRVCTVVVAANPETSERTATVTFTTSKGASATVNVTQNPADGISPQSLSFGLEGGSANVAVEAWYTVSASVSEGWISVTGGSGTFTIMAAANTAGARSGSVTFTTELGASAVLSVSQEAADNLELSQTEVTLSPEDTTFSVTVTANYALNVTTDGQQWLTVTGSDGSYSVHVSANEDVAQRTAVITFTTARGASKTLTVTQNGVADSLELDISGKETTSYGARFEVRTISNYPVTAVSEADWITVSQSRADVFAVRVERNASGSERSGSIVFTTSKGASKTLAVRQGAAGTGGDSLPAIDIISADYDD